MTSGRSIGVVLATMCVCLAAMAGAASAAGPPILVVTGGSGTFGSYLPQILQAEGLNDFTTAASVGAASLGAYDVVVVGPGPVSDADAAALTNWVNAGGNLIAMRPGANLAPVLGLSGPGTTLSNAYLKVNTGSGPGVGIVGETMQYHGAAATYALNGATTVATLYSDAATATASPAVTLNSVGPAGGQAAAFAYDLAQSVVQTRQGNPAWAGQDRDGVTPTRSDDLFFGGAQPDWVDPAKVAIPQADEQQRLLANLITQMAATPLPRFAYLPRGLKAAVVLTGDDHGTGASGTNARFANNAAASAPGCSVVNWECVRSTSYVFPSPVDVTEVPAGNELALHAWVSGSPNGSAGSGLTACNDFPSLSSFGGDLTLQLAQFNNKFAAIAAAPVTNRNHCVIWSDWDSVAQAEAAHGIRLDTNYYYWPGSWVNQRAGLMTGSGFPMRFAQTNGTPIDVYQATTQVNDELTGDVASDLNTELAFLSTLLNNAFDKGYYGVFTANNHTDISSVPGGDDVIDAVHAKAIARGVQIPIISAKQLLDWVDGRNGSSFQSVSFAAGQLSFQIAPGPKTTGLQAMLPINGSTGALQGLARDGQAVGYVTQTIKGIAYATFDAVAGSYVATYPAPAVGPAAAPGTAGSTSKSVAAIRSMQVLPRKTKAPTFPRLKISATTLRPGGGRSLAITFRLKHTSRVTLTIRNAKGKVVRRIRAPKHKAHTVLRLRWDGKDSRRHYVKAGALSLHRDGDRVALPEDRARLGAASSRPTERHSSSMATTRAGAALAPTMRSGKQLTRKPVLGSAPRLVRRSIWE